MAEAARVHHARSMRDLLASGKYSDLTITCGSDTHKVHKAIVCTRSGFFERAERFGKESATGVIDLPEDEPAIIALLLQFLYTSEYTFEYTPEQSPEDPKLRNDVGAPARLLNAFPHTCSDTKRCLETVCTHHTCSENCSMDCIEWICRRCCRVKTRRVSEPLVYKYAKGGPENLLLHSKVYTIADKYDVPGLKGLAKFKFGRSCLAFGKDENFIIAAEHVFTTTPNEDDGLRLLVRDILVENKKILRREDVQSFLEARPVLMYDIMCLATE